MEELRSTEALDREILEDARKKASRILKTADDSIAALKQAWEKKKEDALDSIRKSYSQRNKKARDEIFARLPLDKRRLRSESAEGLMKKAMDDFLKGLPREKILSVLEGQLLERLKAWAEGEQGNPVVPQATIRYSGLSLSQARGVLKKATDAINSTGGSVPQEDYPFKWEPADDTAGSFPFIVIDARSFRLTASVQDAALALMKDKRAELAAALLGEGVLDD